MKTKSTNSIHSHSRESGLVTKVEIYSLECDKNMIVNIGYFLLILYVKNMIISR